jgi:thiosulfate reductase cytochrome b subunit
MVIAFLYTVGLIKSGAYKALLPRRSDLRDGLKMFWYYLRVVPSFLMRKANPHPVVHTKYNALQRAAYFSVSVFSFLSILTGWAIHKPAQLG